MFDEGSRSLPRVAASVVVADFADELVVLVPQRRRAHHLDTPLAVVFDSCRSGHTIDRVVDDIVATGSERSAAEGWVRRALEALTEQGVLESNSHAVSGVNA